MNDEDTVKANLSSNPEDWVGVTTTTTPCEECLSDRRRAALIGVGIGVSIAFSVGLLILPFVARK